MFNLPGGALVLVCAKRDLFPDGKEFIGYGIEPDIEAETKIKALNIEPANPEQLILVMHSYDELEWKSSNKAIARIISRSNKLLNRLKQRQNLVSSVHDFFDAMELSEKNK